MCTDSMVGQAVPMWEKVCLLCLLMVWAQGVGAAPSFSPTSLLQDEGAISAQASLSLILACLLKSGNIMPGVNEEPGPGEVCAGLLGAMGPLGHLS